MTRLLKWLKRLGLALAYSLAGIGRIGLILLSLLAISVWALGTRGVPLTAAVAEKIMGGQLTIAHAEGGLFGPIVLDGLVLDQPAARTEIDHLRLDWSPLALWSRTLHIESLEIGQISVQLKAHPAQPPEPVKPNQPNQPRHIVLQQLHVAGFELRPITGAPLLLLADLSARARWRQNLITLESLQLSQAQLGQTQLGRVQASARVELAPKAIVVQQFNFTGPANITASGSLGLLGETSDLRATISDGLWPLQGAAQVRVPKLMATAHGVLSGGPLDLKLSLQGALRTAVAAQALGFDLDSVLRLQAGGAQIERLRLVSTDGAGSLTAQGDAAWQPALTIDATIDIQKLNPGVLLPNWQGQLNGHLQASTQIIGQRPEVRFSATLNNSTLRGYPLQLDARGLASVQGTSQHLQLDALSIASGGSRLTAEGSVLPLLNARLRLNAADLHSVLATLTGSVQLTASAVGAPQAPNLQAQASLRNFRFNNTALASATLSLHYLAAGDSHAALSTSGLQLGHTHIASASLAVDGRAERHSITLHSRLTQPTAEASLTLVGAANLSNKTWQGTLQQSAFTPPFGPSWQQEAPGALTLAAQQQALEATCWHAGTARLCLDATLAAPLTRIGYRIEQLDSAAFAALLPEGWLLQTAVNGHGLVAFNGAVPETLDLALSLDPGRIAIPGALPLQLLPSSLTVQQAGGVWQAKAKLAVDRGSLELDASMPVAGGALAERPISGQVRVAVPDLAWLTPLVPGVKDLQGQLNGGYRIAGSVSAPELDGALTLSGGSVRVPAAGIVLTDISAEARTGNSPVASNIAALSPLTLSASATSGGTVQLVGTADFASGMPVVQLKITGDNLQIADIADARVWVSPNLLYRQNAEGIKLSGSVTIPKAEITPRKLAANAIGASGDQVLVGVDAPAATKPVPLTAEVTVVLGEAVSFEGFGLKSKLQGSVTAVDSPGRGGTRGFGELRLIDAAYKAYGQQIQVETGRILFNGGPIAQPTIDIVARRSPREDVSVSLHVRGTLDQPTFDLSSSPGMPREQQLGWLIFGQPIGGGGGGANGEFSGAAAALSLGIAGGDALASRLGKIVGLDQVSLGADTSSSAWQASGTAPSVAGTDQTRFTVGKYLSPKLFVSYGVGLFANGNVLRLLYDLGHGFKLRTESGLETGGDLLYFKEH